MIDDLKKMLADISKYKRNKNDLLEMYIKERLNKSLETYYDQLSSSLEYLVSKDSIRVLKNSDRI